MFQGAKPQCGGLDGQKANLEDQYAFLHCGDKTSKFPQYVA